MDTTIIEKRYLRINKRLGTSTGFWPGERSFKKTAKRVIILSFMISGYIPQVMRLIIYCNVNTFLTDAPYLVVSLGTLCKTSNYLINEAKLKVLLGGIVKDWWAIKSETEYKIMLKYGEKGFLIATLYLLHVATPAASFCITSFLPTILDIIRPLNHSRNWIYAYPVHYGFDNERYHLIIIVHMAFILILTCILFGACDMNYIYAVQHACGLFAITGDRFKYACYDLQIFDKTEVDKAMHRMYRNVCHSIRAHQRATEFVGEIQRCHGICLFISMGMMMGSIAASLLMVSSSEFGTIWFFYSMFLVAQLFHMFFLVVQGQFVVNAQDDLYNTIWEAMWYNTTPKTQALYLLVLRRSLTPPLLTAGFVTLNLKSFTEVIKASVSYYTVMRSK